MNPIFTYISDIAVAHKDLLFWLLRKLERSPFRWFGMRATNLKLRLRGQSIRVGYDKTEALFVASEKGRRHYFGNLERGSWLYRRGFQHRADEIWDSYRLGAVDFAADDIVIDCGANYADLWLALEGKLAPQNYISFEPGEDEHRAICLNAPQAKNKKQGLGNKDEVQKFYVNHQDADSSLIEPNEYFDVLKIDTVRLDSFCKSEKIDKIKLLKLEAEGFEPEILAGAAKTLEKVEYVAIDGSYERGKEQEQTFSTQSNILQAAGFEMVDVNLKWARALFKRRDS